MIVSSDYVNIPSGGSSMRTFMARPGVPGNWPGILFYSDIFQLTDTMLRSCVRLAGHGFVVAAPEIYHRREPQGAVFPFDDEGRSRGMADAVATAVADFDVDAGSALEHLARDPAVDAGRLGAAGFCIGGHLAFRAALRPQVKATVCFYPTGVHDGKLGSDDDAGSLEKAGDIAGRLLLVWGSEDPHIPPPARARIESGLKVAGVRFEQRMYPAEHAFMRDFGPRFDPECTDLAFAEMVRFFRATF
ncbi:MAG: dienelactone hydrolase family protein [Rhodocyclaceae bacterium]|nr:dienelactone hydrolase family protein [Rhodocyclaceae bacterium]